MLCHACDSPLPPSMGRKPRKWCSESCRVWAFRYPGEKRSGRACEGCGTDVSGKNRGAVWCSDSCRFRIQEQQSLNSQPAPSLRHLQDGVPRLVTKKTCSKSCEQRARRVAVDIRRKAAEELRDGPKCSVWFKSCAHCGDLFTSKTRSRRCCSKSCSDRDYNQRARPVSPKRCKCGAEIKPTRNKCDACRDAAHKAKKQRERRRRRALKLASVTEPYTLAEIALRDGFRCGLCGCKVRINLAVPHPKAPTIDHVIPISISRDDTKANVQLAHFICNSIKGDRGGDEQLALIG